MYSLGNSGGHSHQDPSFQDSSFLGWITAFHSSKGSLFLQNKEPSSNPGELKEGGSFWQKQRSRILPLTFASFLGIRGPWAATSQISLYVEIFQLVLFTSHSFLLQGTSFFPCYFVGPVLHYGITYFSAGFICTVFSPSNVIPALLHVFWKSLLIEIS